MTKVISIFAPPVLISSIPLLFGSSCFLLKELFTKGFLEISWQNSHDQSFIQMSFGVYSNFFLFLTTMFLIEIIFRILQQRIKGPLVGISSKIPEDSNKNSSLTYESEEVRLFGIISENHIIRLLCYIGIFAILQIAGLGLSLIKNESIAGQHIEDSYSPIKLSETMMLNQSPRILQEEEAEKTPVPNSLSKQSDKISLSMGKILSSLNFDASVIVMSKDRKIAFATIDFYGTLKIIDISDLQSPFVLSSLNLNISGNLFRTKALALSSDEKTLYLCNSRDLEIVDISNPRSPKLISFTISQVFNDGNDDDDDESMFMKISRSFRTSLALDENTKTLFIGGIGLQIYDISNPKHPKLLKGFTNDLKDDRFTRNEICLSNDGKTLFIANGTLDIYNISNPQEMKLLRSISTGSSARSLFLPPEDSKVAFLLGASSDNTEIMLEEVDISDYETPRVIETYKIDYSYAMSSRIIAVSPSRTKFFIRIEEDDRDSHFFVLDSIKRTSVMKEKVLINGTQTMIFSSDGKTLITGSNEQFVIIELFLNYPNSHIFSSSSINMMSNFSFPAPCLKLEISKDGQNLFVLRRNDNDIAGLKKSFEIWDMKDASMPKLLGSYQLSYEIKQMHFVEDLAYLVSDFKILVLNISNREKPNLLKTYKSKNKKEQFLQIETSSDGKTGFITLFENKKGHATVFNLVGEGFERLVTLEKEFESDECRILLRDDKTLMIIDQEITIDISDLHSPIEITSLSIFANEPEPNVNSYLVSADKKTLFLETSDRNGFYKLVIYNISTLKSPKLLSEKYFSKFSRKVNKAKFSLTLDQKTGFIFQDNSLVRVDLTDFKHPKVSGIVPLSTGRSSEVYDYILSPDDERIYVVIDKEIRVLNMNIQHSLYLRKEKFLLGEKFSENIAILNLTERESCDYDAMDIDAYRIIKLSLLDVKIAPNKNDPELKTSLLPSWMTFDRRDNLLTVEPKRQSDLGIYTFHSAFSLKIPMDVFNDLNTTESEDLLAWLISLDFVDNKLFLTENFGSFESFFLPTKFNKYKIEVYNILKKFYVETCTMFEILPSLEFKDESFGISSLSTNEIKVEIKVEGSEAKFVNKPYGSLLPMVRENKTKVVLEGSISEVTTALQSVVVNFENEVMNNASISVIDGLNPQVTRELINISKYFKANKAPVENNKAGKTVQEQVNNAGFQTGSYLSLTLGDDTFRDEHSESLNYDLVMAKDNSNLPNWLSYSGLTLKGTPPEDIFGRDYDMVFIAKNEFKEARVPFKLQVKISSSFIVKLFLKYSSYILTVIGLWVSANKIYNILGKELYKHPKEFKVGAGEEISPSVIFPISFIQEENKQSEIMWGCFEKMNVRFTDFIDPVTKGLDKQKIIDKIQKTVNMMSGDDREKITKYHPNSVIEQIIINKFVWLQLNSQKEIPTKSLFEEVKAQCLEAIERDTSLSLGFTINQKKLNQLLRTQKSSDDTRYSGGEDLEESLISNDSRSLPEGVNMSLLKDAILAFAFENHSIDISPVRTEISVKQKVPSQFLFKFLKLDLKDISFGAMDYGINYRITNDKLYFSGIAQDYLKGKTIVVQIKTRRQRIMKEIWMHGVDRKEPLGIAFRDEQEARGQGYEIF